MAEFFEMPQATPTMEFGTLGEWKVAEGTKLSPQDVIVTRSQPAFQSRSSVRRETTSPP